MHRIAAFILIATLVIAAPLEAGAKAKRNYGKETENPKYAAIVVDAETGVILSQSSPDKIVHPASLTKVMTLLLLFEAMESGNVRPNDRIMVSSRATMQAPSKLGLAAGSSIRVEDAILAIVTKSANDMAYAVAEHLAGSTDRFAERMNYRARSIGMTHTRFVNPHGLHDPRQVTTARDMATLARYVIVRYPNYYRYFSTKQFTYRGKTYTNHNRLMQTYPGMDGFKTGFINASGFNLIASAKHGDRRLIGVVFGGRSWKSRNDKMTSLLNEGFAKGPSTRYAGVTIPAAPRPEDKAVPVPAPKPAVVADAATVNTAPSVMQQNINPGAAGSFASLEALGTNTTQIIVPQQQLANTVVAAATAPPVPDVTGDAIAKVQGAINNGDYSEITGEGDYDPGTAKRIETGLLSAAVYKGEARYRKKIDVAANSQTQNLAAQLQATNTQALVQPASLTPSSDLPVQDNAMPISDSWSIQIGAYTSRVATDDALRRALGKLPQGFDHASPIVVPLQTSEGLLFRGRLGNLSEAQASEACRYFRDCLPIGPR